jgi:plastocyanin
VWNKATKRVFMKQLCLAGSLAWVMALAGCSGSASSQAPTVPTPAPPPNGPAGVTVGIPMGASFVSMGYVPDPITLSVGTTVKWVNNDNVAHTVSSQNNLWDSGDIEPGATYSRTFQSTGSFPYYCVFHPLMVGTITVR